jgi:hypothetical protein
MPVSIDDYLNNNTSPTPPSGLSPLQVALAGSMSSANQLAFNVNRDFAREMRRFASSEQLFPYTIDPNSGLPTADKQAYLNYMTGTSYVIIGEDVFLRRVAQNCGPDETVRYENEYIGKRVLIAEGSYALYGKVIFSGRIGSAMDYSSDAGAHSSGYF